MRNHKGQYVKGHRSSPDTEFKKGEHWRPHVVFREKDYLVEEYINKGRSASEIAADHGVTSAAIAFWLHKNGIPTRTLSEAMSLVRSKRKWNTPSGKENPMYGRTGDSNPNWKGGCSPERQAFYCSQEWADACRQVWLRDRATCQGCGRERSNKYKLCVHHIVSFSVKALRANVGNLVLLCVRCHRWVHSHRNTNQLFLGIKVVENGKTHWTFRKPKQGRRLFS